MNHSRACDCRCLSRIDEIGNLTLVAFSLLSKYFFLRKKESHSSSWGIRAGSRGDENTDVLGFDFIRFALLLPPDNESEMVISMSRIDPCMYIRDVPSALCLHAYY